MEYNLNDQITEDGMGAEHGTFEGDICIKGIGGETWRKETTWKTYA